MKALGIDVVTVEANGTEAQNAAAVAQKIKSGECVGLIGDSTQGGFWGQFATALPPLAVGPYGVATALGNDALTAELSDAMLSMMSDGADSEILALEQEWWSPMGFPPIPTSLPLLTLSPTSP